MVDRLSREIEYPPDAFSGLELQKLYTVGQGSYDEGDFVCRDTDGWAYGQKALLGKTSLFRVRDREFEWVAPEKFCKVTGINIGSFYPANTFSGLELQKLYVVGQGSYDEGDFLYRDTDGWAYAENFRVRGTTFEFLRR